ncbi:MAG: glycoside hydrolase family 140 protein, partial [Bryobacteraceae bacterium]|nr:glycoside hydrolase family 140 protein [Bryobacteraceae bacterium]
EERESSVRWIQPFIASLQLNVGHLLAEHDWRLSPPKPTLDGEPRYEGTRAAYYFEGAPRYQRFDDYDVRQAAYWSLLGGACGHTYGHNSIWQMYAPPKKPASGADIPWQEAMDHPGAFQMGLMRRLFESRPFTKLQPAQHMILDGPAHGGAKIRAALSEDGSFALVYSPQGERFTINNELLRAKQKRAIWFDPRYGYVYLILTAETAGFQTYTPPTSGRGNDWVLIIEDVDKEFPLPGRR